MKRVANILTIFTGVFIFLFLYQNISLNHFNSVNSLERNFAEATGKDIVTIEYKLLGDSDKDGFSEFMSFLKDKNYDAISFVQTRRYDFIIDTTAYLYTEHKMNEFDFFKTVEGYDLDFTENGNKFYSSFINEEGAEDTIDFVNPNYQEQYQPRQTIKQFSSLSEEHPEKKTAMIFIYGKDKQQIKNDIKGSGISKFVVSDDSSFVNELAEPESLDVDAINILLVLTMASLLVITICDLITQKKEITIRKLFGENNSSIYWDLVAKRYVLNLLFFIMTQVILYALIVRNFRPIHVMLLRPLIVAAGLYLLFWISANIISYIMLTMTGKPTNIKKSNIIKSSNTVTILLKLIMIILIVSPFISLVKTAPVTFQENTILRKNKESMKGNLVIEGILFDSAESSLESWKPLEMTLEKVESLDWMYHDFTNNFLPEAVRESIPEEIYKLQFVQHPYIVANEEYLKSYDLRDLNNNPVDYSNLEDNTLLVPQRYMDEEFTDVYYDGGSKRTVYIKNSGILYNPEPFSPDLELKRQKDPVILFKNALDSSMGWNGSTLTIKDDKSAREELTDFLATNSLDNQIFISSMDQAYETAISRSNDQLRGFFLVLGLYILMIFIFQFQSVFVYFHENKEKIAVNCLFGKTYLQRYGWMMASSMAVYFFPLIIGVKVMNLEIRFVLLYTLFGVVFDFIISGVMIRFFEKRKTLSVLKGE